MKAQVQVSLVDRVGQASWYLLVLLNVADRRPRASKALIGTSTSSWGSVQSTFGHLVQQYISNPLVHAPLLSERQICNASKTNHDR